MRPCFERCSSHYWDKYITLISTFSCIPVNLGNKGFTQNKLQDNFFVFLAWYMSLEHTLKGLLRLALAVFHNIRFSIGSRTNLVR